MVKHYRFIDFATQGYVAAVGLLVLAFGRGLPCWYLIVAAHAACLAVVHLLIRSHAARPDWHLIDILRHFYPIILYVALYRETGLLNQIVTSGYFDRFFMGLDDRLFGLQPSVAFMHNLPYLPVSEVFYASYFSYYVMIVGVGAALYFQDKERFFHYVSIVSFVFYVCYLIYIFLPVIGPRVFYVPVSSFAGQQDIPFYPLQFPESVKGGPLFRVMGFIYAHFEAHGAAFPSSHVAVALCALYFSWRYIPVIRGLHAAVVVLLIISTVYCRYHYVVDIYSGVATGVGLLVIGERLYRKLH